MNVKKDFMVNFVMILMNVQVVFKLMLTILCFLATNQNPRFSFENHSKKELTCVTFTQTAPIPLVSLIVSAILLIIK